MTQQNDFQEVRDKVNRVDQRMEDVVLPALSDMKSTLGKMSFVDKKAYIEDQRKINNKLDEHDELLTKLGGTNITMHRGDASLSNSATRKVYINTWFNVGGTSQQWYSTNLNDKNYGGLRVVAECAYI